MARISKSLELFALVFHPWSAARRTSVHRPIGLTNAPRQRATRPVEAGRRLPAGPARLERRREAPPRRGAERRAALPGPRAAPRASVPQVTSTPRQHPPHSPRRAIILRGMSSSTTRPPTRQSTLAHRSCHRQVCTCCTPGGVCRMLTRAAVQTSRPTTQRPCPALLLHAHGKRPSRAPREPRRASARGPTRCSQQI